MKVTDWTEHWHEFTGEGELCTRCGVNRTRAIHSRGFALSNGYEYIDADGQLVEGNTHG